jgi:hypothetical protein
MQVHKVLQILCVLPWMVLLFSQDEGESVLAEAVHQLNDDGLQVQA